MAQTSGAIVLLDTCRIIERKVRREMGRKKKENKEQNGTRMEVIKKNKEEKYREAKSKFDIIKMRGNTCK